MKRFLYYWMTLLGATTISACSPDKTLDNENVLPQTGKTIQQTELAALKACNNLINSFKESISRSGNHVQILYPNYYGGCYLDNNHQLVILVTGNTENCKQEMTTRTQTSDFILKSCTYSYNELNEAMDRLNDFFLNDANDDIVNALKWHSFALSDKDNCIYIRLGICTEEFVNRFKNEVLDEPMLRFETSEGIPVLDSAPQPGGALGYSAGAEQASMGYRAKSSGMEGFVTARHFVGTGAAVYQSYDLVGVCEKSQTGGTIDAAWCSSDSYSPGNTTVGGQRLNSVGTILAMSTVYMEGITTGYSFGQIKNTNASSKFQVSGSSLVYELKNISRC